MTSFKRAWAVAFTVAVAASLGFSGGPARADLLSDIKKRGEFIVGTEARFPPFEFVKDGRIVGLLDRHHGARHEGVAGGQAETARSSLAGDSSWPVGGQVRLRRHLGDRHQGALREVRAEPAGRRRDDGAGQAQGRQFDSGRLRTSPGTWWAHRRVPAQLQALQAFAGKLKGAGKGGQGGSRPTSISTRPSPIWRQEGSAPSATACRTCWISFASGRTGSRWCCRHSVPRSISAGPGARDAKSASLVAFMNEQLARLNRAGVLTALQKKWFGGPMELPSDKLPVPHD